MTNAVVHAVGTELEIAVDVDIDGTRISCVDQDPAAPQPREAGLTETGGRGPALIARLGSSWGHVLEPPPGKTVWLRVERDAVWNTTG